ncbi:MAG TPA: PilN domain-containing protein [Porticoccaceae bacterium]|nr:PilN domain-containing protein [Porticoccaceae bacterium]
MANINLLPWREESRREKKREFIGYLAVTLLVSLVAVVLWVFIVNQQIEVQQARNALLTKEIAALDEKVKEINELKKRREQVLARMRVIQELQANRPDVVRVFDEVVKVLPEGVYLEALSRQGGSISVVGYAESNNRIAAMMRAIEASYKFENPNLTKVVADQRLGEQGNRFDLRIKVAKPEADGQATGAVAAVR